MENNNFSPQSVYIGILYINYLVNLITSFISTSVLFNHVKLQAGVNTNIINSSCFVGNCNEGYISKSMTIFYCM